MPRQETTLTVFVASPSDVGAERECLQNVINEINLTRSRELGIRLELAKWETHAYPGIGIDPQDVINSTVPQDYDIFVGIMWQRFGTPTLRSSSGTLEEFQIAKARYDDDPASVRIMMYFKDKPVAPSKMDHSQMKSISDFRSTLGPQGALYWPFEDTDEFERLARIHLQKAMQDWRDSGFAYPSSRGFARTDLQVAAPQNSGDDTDNQLGLLDLTLEFTDRFSEAGVHMGESNLIMEKATAQIAKLTARIVAHGKIKTPAQMRQIVSLTTAVASALNEFGRDFFKSANSADDNVEAGIDAMIKMVELQPVLNTDEDKQAAIELIQTMENVQNSIENYRDRISGNALSLSTIPPITRDLNKARRSLEKMFSNVVERQERAVALIRELKQATFSLIQNNTSKPDISS